MVDHDFSNHDFRKDIRVLVKVLRKSVHIQSFTVLQFLAFQLNNESESLYSTQVRENTDQKNSKCGTLLGSVFLPFSVLSINIMNNVLMSSKV